MNHKENCSRSDYYHSGKGYNRVRVCACGAEDHDPDPKTAFLLRSTCEKVMEDEAR